MQTPISFALEILLDCETIEKAHKACRKYIKALEAAGSKPTIMFPQTGYVATTNGPQPPVQAPSTQRLLEQHGLAPVAAPPIAAPAKIVGGEVNNGDGTRGKRKW